MKILFAAVMMALTLASRGADLPSTITTCCDTPKVVKETPKKEVVVPVQQPQVIVVVVQQPKTIVLPGAPAPVAVAVPVTEGYYYTSPISPVQPQVIVPRVSMMSESSTFVPASYSGYGGYATGVYATQG